MEFNFIVRIPDPVDLRAVKLQLTEDGAAFVHEYKEAIGLLLRDKIELFNDEQLIRFHRALIDLHEVLKSWTLTLHGERFFSSFIT